MMSHAQQTPMSATTTATTTSTYVPEQEPVKEGQRKATPPPADATRVFYESLYHQRPDSIMAAKFCVQYGILDGNNLKKALKRLKDMDVEWGEGGVDCLFLGWGERFFFKFDGCAQEIERSGGRLRGKIVLYRRTKMIVVVWWWGLRDLRERRPIKRLREDALWAFFWGWTTAVL